MSTGFTFNNLPCLKSAAADKSPECAGTSPAGNLQGACARCRTRSVCGHLRAPTLYSVKSAEDAAQHLAPIGQESAQPHASQCPPEEYIFSGPAHPFNFSTPVCFLCCTMRLTERGSQAFPYEDPHPNTHT